MSDSGLKQARALTDKGFHYENLVDMAKYCHEESHPDRILSAYVLNRVLAELAEEVGDGPVLTSELRKLEAKYRTALNLALESAIAGAPKKEQDRRLTELVHLRWTSQDAE
jgi:phytoene/squalene synthetase